MPGRRRSPLAGSGFQAQLAQRLRDVRDASGLTLRQLAAKSGYSQSALSQAESARAVPSWELVATFVQTCGEDPANLRSLWELAHAAPLSAARSEPRQTAAEGDAMPAAEPTRRRWRRRVLVATAAGLIAASSSIAWLIADSRTTSLGTTTPLARVTAARDGTDPQVDHCTADAEQLNSRPVYRKGGSLFGSIVLIYSASCQAAWGRLDAPNSSAWTVHIIAHRIPGPGIAAWQFSGNVGFGSWGNVLSTRHGCVYAEAYVVDKSGEGPHARTSCVQPM